MKPKILIVEDSPIHLLIVSKYINNYVLMDSVTSAKGAIKMLKEQRYDLVLVDIDLVDKDLNGIDVLKMSKSMLAYQGVPIIAFTGYEKEELEKIKHHNFTEFIEKPLSEKVIFNILQKYLF